MAEYYQHLGIFSDLIQFAPGLRKGWPRVEPGSESQKRVLEALNFSPENEMPQAIQVERTWELDGVVGEEVSWWVGYGPRTYAWVLKPIGAGGALPGVVALHDHGGFKYYGKEKIADGPDFPDGPPPILKAFRDEGYGGVAYANLLAKEGFTVLVPDTFLWGSRRFPLETIPEGCRKLADIYEQWWFQANYPQPEIVHYNAAASQHEDIVERCCNLAGTTLAGLVNYEDRVAANYLATRPDVDAAHIGCIGLSGGGCRAALLGATSNWIVANVIIGMMSTYESLLDQHTDSHTWMLFPKNWTQIGDWTDLAAVRAPSPLLVQNNLQDELFSVEGMRAADLRLAEHYRTVGKPENYRGEFYQGLHKFDREMQVVAFQWLKPPFKWIGEFFATSIQSKENPHYEKIWFGGCRSTQPGFWSPDT